MRQEKFLLSVSVFLCIYSHNPLVVKVQNILENIILAAVKDQNLRIERVRIEMFLNYEDENAVVKIVSRKNFVGCILSKEGTSKDGLLNDGSN